MILSFAYTTPALLAGAKTVTRRAWSPNHARHFHTGQVVDAYDRSPRNGGRKVAEVRLRAFDPTPIPITLMPESDYEPEGFAWLHANGHVPPPSSGFKDFSRETFHAWRHSGQDLYVVRFELIGRLDGAR